jgi:cytoskeleton protein RodZ
MEDEHFGDVLRRAREGRAMPLSDVAHRTKVARATLEALEKGELATLPAPVYVRGFIRSFARAVGADELASLALYERALDKRNTAREEKESIPTLDPEALLATGATGADDESGAPRRRLGLAVFVIILLLIATITLSLLLRRPPQSGEGLSERMIDRVPAATLG